MLHRQSPRPVWSKQFFRWGLPVSSRYVRLTTKWTIQLLIANCKGSLLPQGWCGSEALAWLRKGSCGHLVYWTVAGGLWSSGNPGTEPAFVSPELLRTEWNEKLQAAASENQRDLESWSLQFLCNFNLRISSLLFDYNNMLGVVVHISNLRGRGRRIKSSRSSLVP